MSRASPTTYFRLPGNFPLGGSRLRIVILGSTSRYTQFNGFPPTSRIVVSSVIPKNVLILRMRSGRYFAANRRCTLETDWRKYLIGARPYLMHADRNLYQSRRNSKGDHRDTAFEVVSPIEGRYEMQPVMWLQSFSPLAR